MIQFTIPLKTVNPLNGAQGRSRGAVFAKAARRKKEREAANMCMRVANQTTTREWKEQLAFGTITVTLTRRSAGTLDGDGLQAALKSIRDGIADYLQVDDGSDAVIWSYAQRKCARGEFGVEVTIT